MHHSPPIEKEKKEEIVISRTTLRGACAAATAVISLTLCTSCSAPPESVDLAPLQALRAECDPDQLEVDFVALDSSNSSDSDAIHQSRLAVLEELARRSVVCEGRIVVVRFTSTAASTDTVIDESFALAGATDNAKLRRAPDEIARVQTLLTDEVDGSASSLPEGGSDVLGMYNLAAQLVGQLKGPAALHVTLLTDGFTNVGIKLDRKTKIDDVDGLVDATDVPDLPGASITVAGLGDVAGKAVRSSAVEALIAYYDGICDKAKAASCVSVTDWR